MNKKLLTIAIAGAMAAPMSAQAVKYKMSGQVNRAVSFMDDGDRSDVRNTDNGASNTRFRMRGTEDLGNGMMVGAYWELGIDSSPSGSAVPDLGSDGNHGIGVRQANVFFSGNWGKLTLGHTSEAGDGGTSSDLSGTNLTHSGAGRTDNSGGLVWRGKGMAADYSREGRTYTKYDGGRRDVIRYDSPSLGPVGIAASVGNDQNWGVMGTVNGAMGGGELSAALFYLTSTGGANTPAVPRNAANFVAGSAASIDNGTEKRYGGSLSYLFSQGTSIGGHYVKNEKERGSNKDSKSWSVSLGHQWGMHAVQASYTRGDDIVSKGDEDTGYAVEYVHTLKKANTKLYAGFLHSELDRSGTDKYEDHNIFTVGALVKFD